MLSRASNRNGENDDREWCHLKLTVSCDWRREKKNKNNKFIKLNQQLNRITEFPVQYLIERKTGWLKRLFAFCCTPETRLVHFLFKSLQLQAKHYKKKKIKNLPLALYITICLNYCWNSRFTPFCSGGSGKEKQRTSVPSVDHSL